MDKLVKHAIRMLEIVEGENDFFRNDAKRQADIARAVYDVILRVQAMERKADRKTEPFDKDINVRSKTENSSEIPNNCEHITEDGVTCAKYPACDDCLDNPLNKVKGSERLVKGSEQTEPTGYNLSPVDKDINVRSKIEQTEREASMSLINRQALLDKIEITPFEDYGDYITVRDLVAQFPTAERNIEPQPSKIIEAYAKGYKDGADAVNAMPQTNADQHVQHVESVETMSCQECRRWIYDDRWGWFCPLKGQDECKYEPKTEPQADGILFKGNLKEGDYKLIKTTNGWVLEGDDIAYCGEPKTDCPWK